VTGSQNMGLPRGCGTFPWDWAPMAASSWQQAGRPWPTLESPPDSAISTQCEVTWWRRGRSPATTARCVAEGLPGHGPGRWLALVDGGRWPKGDVLGGGAGWRRFRRPSAPGSEFPLCHPIRAHRLECRIEAKCRMAAGTRRLEAGRDQRATGREMEASPPF